MKKIAIYSRKSKFTGKGESIENQILKCKQFIKFKFETEEIEIFIDEGFSGKNEDRPRYQEMLSKVKDEEIDKIVIYQLNRLGRNARDIHNTMQMCDDLGCVIYSATEGFDSSTSFGRALIGILASLAQLEREQLAERVKDNMYTLAKMGRWLGGQSPLGFKGTREYYIDENGKERSVTELKPNKEELQIVKSLYDKYLEEKSLSQVGKWTLINNLKGKNGADLGKSVINSTLQNPVYVKSDKKVIEFLENNGYEVYGKPNGNGLLRYGKDNIAAIAKHKGVIEPDKWLEVQRLLKANSLKAPAIGTSKKALLSGLLTCKCGSKMQVRYGKPRKDGTRTYYYLCSMKVNSSGVRCNAKNINGELLESKLIEYLKVYNKEKLIKNLKEMIEESNDINNNFNLENIDNDINTNNAAIKKLLTKLTLNDDEEVSKTILDEIKKLKDANKDLENKKFENLNKQSSICLSQLEINNAICSLERFNASYDKLSFEDKKKALNDLLDSIIIDDCKIHLKFNIKKKLLTDWCQIRTSHRSVIIENDISCNELFYSNIECNSLRDNFEKSIKLKGYNQNDIVRLTKLDRSTINQFAKRDFKIDTLKKIISVIGDDFCDDYCRFILNQSENIKQLINKYGIKNLVSKLNVARSTIERWRDNIYQVKINQYKKIKNLK